MTTASKVLIVIVIIVAISAGGLAWALSSHNSNEDKTNTSQTENGPNNNSNQNGDHGVDQAAPTEVTITYNGSSFSLSANTIQAGGTVTVINESNGNLDFDSDPHPSHTDNPELNAGDIPAGERQSFVLTTTGTWGFHNHLNSTQRGSIEVR